MNGILLSSGRRVARRLLPAAAAFSLLLAFAAAAHATQYAIIKADDFIYDSTTSTGISQPYEKFIQPIKDKGVKAGIGFIGNRDSDPRTAPPAPLFQQRVQQLASDSRFEIWNHGFLHDKTYDDDASTNYFEFKLASVAESLNWLNQSRDAFKTLVGASGITHSFGAPGNEITGNLATAIAQYNNQHPTEPIKLWFYVPGTVVLPPNVITVPRTNLEVGGVIDVAGFKARYDPNKPVICFQLHPRSKSDADIVKIGEAIQFLKEKGAVFVTPHEYYQIKTGGTPPPAPPAAPSNVTATASAYVATATGVTTPSAGGGGTPPTIGSIADQAIDEAGATGAIAFTIGDAETAATALTVTATPSNTTLMPNGNIVLGGSAARPRCALRFSAASSRRISVASPSRA